MLNIVKNRFLHKVKAEFYFFLYHYKKGATQHNESASQMEVAVIVHLRGLGLMLIITLING